jgi:hypothetical protein
MLGAIVICSAPPFIIERIKKPNWYISHPDPVLLEVDEFGDDLAHELAMQATERASSNGASTPQPVGAARK